MTETWFLLFDGTSEDGRGTPDYIGRTVDAEVARRHLEKCRKSPYCTGKVMVATDGGFTCAWYWDKLVARLLLSSDTSEKPVKP